MKQCLEFETDIMAKYKESFRLEILLLIIIVCHSFVDTSAKHTAPKLRVEPTDTYVIEGQRATLSCRASGQPAPRLVSGFS